MLLCNTEGQRWPLVVEVKGHGVTCPNGFICILLITSVIIVRLNQVHPYPVMLGHVTRRRSAISGLLAPSGGGGGRCRRTIRNF